ncbi:putative proton-dependent oligopeptide transporter family, MFS transporter superfamily [Helianthus annuus]|uniref:Proton-dependent oligopeptide transporter family, MFS transporter superfamily n=1 Tax=Helianthus annuus TaxID=4232 RepID=A0A251VDE1_HELAN|nr:putative proton-dependent oligopeptide transporter family, MFS transporter superfamily [Helianthus annuus]
MPGYLRLQRSAHESHGTTDNSLDGERESIMLSILKFQNTSVIDMKNDNDNGTSTGTGVDSPLLNNFVYGVIDYKGRPVLRSKSGCWRSAYFIIGVEVAERIAYYGVSSNLITYLTGPLGQSTATAAENVNVWAGTASLLPLVGAFIADAFLGRYLTVILASLLYILALALLAFSTLIPSDCTNSIDGGSSCSPQLQVIIFFIALYLVAFAQGGHKPCVQAFGADQFDADDPEELKSKSSFFNWWYFGLCAGPTVAIIVLEISCNFSKIILANLSNKLNAAENMYTRFGSKPFPPVISLQSK